MSTKYDINTYPEYYQVEDSDTEAGNLKLTEEKKATYVNSHPYSDEFFQPQCIFTKEKNNLSFFNSDSTNRKYKSINKNMKQINYDSDVIKKKILQILQIMLKSSFLIIIQTQKKIIKIVIMMLL